MSKIALRTCSSEDEVDTTIADHKRAGYSVNEDKSLKATDKSGEQTIVLERGAQELHITLAEGAERKSGAKKKKRAS